MADTSTNIAALRAQAYARACRRTLSHHSHLSPVGRPLVTPVDVMGIPFPNPLGIAAGFDTTGELGRRAGTLGFGAIELGTWTPDRWPDRAISQALPGQMKPVLGISLGVPVSTSTAQVIPRLLPLIDKAWPIADYLCVRPSWFTRQTSFSRLHASLKAIKDHQGQLSQLTGRRIPLVLKLRSLPGDNGLHDLVPYLSAMNIDGIAVAFDLGKPATPAKFDAWQDPALQRQVCRELELYRKMLPDHTALITVGGVSERQHYLDRLNAGASLVQLHNALVYRGIDVGTRILGPSPVPQGWL